MFFNKPFLDCRNHTSLVGGDALRFAVRDAIFCVFAAGHERTLLCTVLLREIERVHHRDANQRGEGTEPAIMRAPMFLHPENTLAQMIVNVHGVRIHVVSPAGLWLVDADPDFPIMLVEICDMMRVGGVVHLSLIHI